MKKLQAFLGKPCCLAHSLHDDLDVTHRTLSFIGLLSHGERKKVVLYAPFDKSSAWMEKHGLRAGFLGELGCSRIHGIMLNAMDQRAIRVWNIMDQMNCRGDTAKGESTVVRESKSSPRLVRTQSRVPTMSWGHGNGLCGTNIVESRGTLVFGKIRRASEGFFSLRRKHSCSQTSQPAK